MAPRDEPALRQGTLLEGSPEYAFTVALYTHFNAGTVPLCPEGCLRTNFIASVLHTYPDRVSKKFNKLFPGRPVPKFARRGELDAAAGAALADLEGKFRAWCLDAMGIHLPEPPLTGAMTDAQKTTAAARYGRAASTINARMKAQREEERAAGAFRAPAQPLTRKAAAVADDGWIPAAKELVEAFCGQYGRWYTAKVVKVDAAAGKATVHYCNWKKAYDSALAFRLLRRDDGTLDAKDKDGSDVSRITGEVTPRGPAKKAKGRAADDDDERAAAPPRAAPPRAPPKRAAPKRAAAKSAKSARAAEAAAAAADDDDDDDDGDDDDDDPRELRVCAACDAAGRGVLHCRVAERHGGGLSPLGFEAFAACMAATPSPAEPRDGPGASAAVDARLTGLRVPAELVPAVLDFAAREASATTAVQGGRRSVYVEGAKSSRFQSWAKGKPTGDGKRGSKAPLDHDPDAVAGGRRWRMARRFLRRCRCAVAFQAAHQWPGAKSVRFSDDALCLIGADEAQVPHVDLFPGQCQAVVALSRGSPTLVFDGPTPTVEDAFRLACIDPASTSMWADLLRTSPALALPRDRIFAGMRDATRRGEVPAPAAAPAPAPARPRRGGDDEAAPRSKDVWNAGSIFVGDHAMVHAGPRDAIRDPASPRVVLFTTFVVSDSVDGGGPGASYDVRDQYMPYFLAEDETMPPERAWALLKEWKKEKPWSHYPGDKKSKAVHRLATSPVLPPATVAQLVAELRAPED